jgi:hypothetical protein
MNWRPIAIGLLLAAGGARGALFLTPALRQAVLCGLFLFFIVAAAFLLWEILRTQRMLDQVGQNQAQLEVILRASDRSRALIDDTIRAVRENLPHHNPFPPSHN